MPPNPSSNRKRKRIAAAQDAETKAVELTVRAKAEKEAAELQAAAIIELAEATRKKGLAEAEAQRALNDAINVLSDEPLAALTGETWRNKRYLPRSPIVPRHR